MHHVRAMLARIAGMFTKHRADDDLRAEFQSHIEMEIAEFVRRGMAPEVARRKALLASGGLAQAAEAVRSQRGVPWLEHLASDVRYALRALRHSPAFSAVVIVTLALGIGANTAIFSVMRGVLLKPLPQRDGDRLVYLQQSIDDASGERNVLFSVPEVRDLRRAAPSLGGIAEYSPWYFTLRGDHEALKVDVGLVTGNFFDVMGLTPALGRLIQPSDDGAGAAPVIVLTHDFWTRHFGGDSSIIGRRLRLNDTSAVVVGVVRPAPYFPDRVDAMLNTVVSSHHMSALMVQSRSHRMTEAIARLAPNATVEQARREVTSAHAQMLGAFPSAYDPGSHYRVSVVPFKDAIGARARLTLWLLMGAASFVMIISVANVVNLTLMRGVRRQPELVVRVALGAGVARLRRLLLVENLVLALAGGMLGALIAMAGVPLLRAFVERYSPRAEEIQLDVVTLGFTFALSVGVAVLLSFSAYLPPEDELASSISAGRRSMNGRMGRQQLQRVLVVAQVAVSVVLLAGAGLLTRTMIQLSEVSTGLGTEEVLTMPVTLLDPTQINAGSDGAAKLEYDRIQRGIRALPGVVEVGLGSTMPLRSTVLDFDINVEGRVPPPGSATRHADFRTASPEYFRAAGIPLIEGRGFAAGDGPGTPRVAIINKALAEEFFAGEDPIGKRVAWTGDVLQFAPISREWRTIVGVVGNTRDGGLDAVPRRVVFMPFAQEMVLIGGIVIRADSNVAALASAATGIVRRIAPLAPIETMLTVSQIKDQSVAPRRLNAALIAMCGALAALIAAVGIGGVLAFSVSTRTSEIGIRMSLGASPARVRGMILREGALLLSVGLAFGLLAAFFGSSVIRGLLFGVAPHDPLTLGVVAAAMAVIGLVACWVPARRAARISPAIAMRS